MQPLRARPQGRLFFQGVLLVALFATAASVFFQRATRAQEKLFIARAEESVRLKLESGVARLSDNLALLATTLGSDLRVQNALAAGDSEALQRDWAETFAHLRARHQLVRFSLLDPDLRYLVRLHDHGSHHEVTDRPTLHKASQTRSAIIGIETGTRGQPSPRLACPVSQGDHLVGFLDLGMSRDSILTQLAADHQIEPVLNLEKNAPIASADSPTFPPALAPKTGIATPPGSRRSLHPVPAPFRTPTTPCQL
jgi:hypothetical protein